MLGSGEIVAMDSPEWLPAGWTNDFKVLRSGRKVNMYTSMETGKRLFSKDDVLHYIKMAYANKENPQSTDKSLSRPSELNSSLLLNENEHPEWLPKDWKVVVKTRYSGAAIGRKYKIFIDPHGYRLFSKPQVIRYLTTGEQKSCTRRYVQNERHKKSHITKKKNTGTYKQFVMNKVEDLPPGWIKEIKIRSTDPSKKDPFYTDPVSGYIFRSKKDVIRYLGTGDINHCACRPRKTSSNDQDLTSNEIEVTPSSTAKKQKLNHPASRRQLFADEMNSETSILALSKTEGNFGSSDPYAARADIIQQKFLLENLVHECAEIEQNCASDISLLSEAEISKVTPGTGNVADTEPDSTSAPDILLEEYSIIDKTHIKASKFNGKKIHGLSRRFSKRLAGLEPYDVVKSFPAKQAPEVIKKSGIDKATHDVGLMANNMLNVASQQPKAEQETELTRSASIDVNTSLCICPSNKSMMPLQMVEADKTDTEEPDKKFSFLFDSDPCLEFAFKTLTGELPVTDTADKGPHCYPSAGILESKLGSGMKNCHNAKLLGTSSKSRRRKEQNLPKRYSKRLAGLEPELEVQSGGTQLVFENATRAPYESGAIGVADSMDEAGQLKTGPANHAYRNINTLAEPWNKTNKSLEDPDVSREQPQMLGTQSADLEKLEPQLSSPLGNYWSDPSHDFSFEILTGATPMKDSLFNDHFEEQHNSSQKQKDDCFVLPDYRSFSFFQSDVSSYYDTLGQQNSMNSSFLAGGNSSLPSCSNPQQKCLEGKNDFPGKVKS